MSQITALLNSRATAVGVLTGVAYGLVARIVFMTRSANELFGVMTIAFLVMVPIVVGALTVSRSDNPSKAFRVFGPWLPMFLTLVATAVLGWEGAICIYLAIPVVFPFASIGGIVGGYLQRQRLGMQSLILALPFVAGPLESRVGNPVSLVRTTQQIEIAAPPSIVWPLVASVDSIKPEEESRALFLTLGFPQPISATLSHPGKGGIRSAKFEGGVVFTETVTEWIPGRKLSFTIDPNTDAIPPTTLDPHVTIGGPYFDVLTGTYELVPSSDGKSTRLILHSTHRVSTHFNLYSGWWADRIMASIQRNILVVHKQRAEKLARASST
jgi:hypothetical protein